MSGLVKCGVVGCGVIAHEAYLPLIPKVADLVATCDRVEARAKRSMELWGAREYYTDVGEMLEKSEVEAVFILTGMGSHGKLVAKVAEAGKHVLVQKPLATNMEDANAAVDAVRKAGVKALVEPFTQKNPVYIRAKDLLDSGTIGRALWFRAGLGRDAPTWGEDTFFTKEAGGPLFDLGVYPISALTFLLGPAKRVVGMATTSLPERLLMSEDAFTEHLAAPEYESFFGSSERFQLSSKVKVTAMDNTFTLMDMAGGSLGVVVSNFVTPSGLSYGKPRGALPNVEIYGEKGALFFGGTAPLTVWAPEDLPGARGRLAKSTWERSERWRYSEASTRHLLDCIVNDREPLASIEWGRHVSEIMVESIESSRTGKAVELATSF